MIERSDGNQRGGGKGNTPGSIVLPDVPIVYSFHEYIPICYSDGHMIRTKNDELCEEESPRRCHECFPGISPQTFFMRKRFIQSHLSLVDCFIVPSEYVAERYEQWIERNAAG